jgi:hypothetical protein
MGGGVTQEATTLRDALRPLLEWIELSDCRKHIPGALLVKAKTALSTSPSCPRVDPNDPITRLALQWQAEAARLKELVDRQDAEIAALEDSAQRQAPD